MVKSMPCAAYPAGELKHGAIALIGEGTPVFAICTQEELLIKMGPEFQNTDGAVTFWYNADNQIHTARICAATSPDGVRQWERLASNPLVSPGRDCWDGDACYKPSVVFEPDNSRWRLWYNGRLKRAEYVGMAEHPGVTLE